jgi:integrase
MANRSWIRRPKKSAPTAAPGKPKHALSQSVTLYRIMARANVYTGCRLHADRYRQIGSTKSETSARVVPIGPMLVNTLRQWKWTCPKGDMDLVFPTARGVVEHHKNVARAVVERPCVAAGLVDVKGKPRYGLHSLRHYYASWCINRRADGGLELPLKVVSYRLGHAGIQIATMGLWFELCAASLISVPPCQ